MEREVRPSVLFDAADIGIELKSKQFQTYDHLSLPLQVSSKFSLLFQILCKGEYLSQENLSSGIQSGFR